MKAQIDVTKYREVPLGADGKPWDRGDPTPEIVRTADGRLYMRRVIYWAHLPPLEIPERASPLLVHALRKESWRAAWHDDRNPVEAASRIAARAALIGDTAGDDERIAWAIADLTYRTVLSMACDLAGLTEGAAEIRALPRLSAKNVKAARWTFRRVGRAAERIAPYIPEGKRPPETEVDKTLDGAQRRSGLRALWGAVIGCDVEGGSDSGDWPAVQRVYDLVERVGHVEDAEFPAYRVAGKVATVEQAERFAEQLNAIVEEFFLTLPRSPSRRHVRRVA